MFRIFVLLAILALMVPAAFADGASIGFIATLGDDGTVHTFSSGTFSLVAEGFQGSLPTDLWAKNQGSTEFGLGDKNGVFHEITNSDFVQLNLTSIIARSPLTLTLGLNSIQGDDTYDVWGSNAFGVKGTLLASNQTAGTFNLEPFIGKYGYFSITVPGKNESVLIDAVNVTTPEPGTLLLLGAGLLGLAFLGRKFVLSQQSIVAESR